MAIRCHQHEEQPLVAWCSQCARPCCRDCCLEIFGHYFCERCKNAMAHDLQRDAVQAAASRAPLIATVGLFLAGFLIGPYALWRARTARGHVQARPWMRGKWQVYAAFFLGSVAAVQGILVLAGRLLGGE
jgi:hypothetical protein